MAFHVKEHIVKHSKECFFRFTLSIDAEEVDIQLPHWSHAFEQSKTQISDNIACARSTFPRVVSPVTASTLVDCSAVSVTGNSTLALRFG